MVTDIVAQNEAKFKALLETARQKRTEREAARQAAEAAQQQADLFAAQERYQMALATARAALPEPLRGRIMDSFNPQHNRFNPYEFYVDLGDGLNWFYVGVEMNRGRNDEWPAGDYVVTGFYVCEVKWEWHSDEDDIAFKAVSEGGYYHSYKTLEEALEAAVAAMDQAAAWRAEYRQEYEEAKQRRARLEQAEEQRSLPENCPPAEPITQAQALIQQLDGAADWAGQDRDLRAIYIVLKVIAKALIVIAEREV